MKHMILSFQMKGDVIYLTLSLCFSCKKIFWIQSVLGLGRFWWTRVIFGVLKVPMGITGLGLSPKSYHFSFKCFPEQCHLLL